MTSSVASISSVALVSPAEMPSAMSSVQASAFDAALHEVTAAGGLGQRAAEAALSRLENFQAHAAHFGQMPLRAVAEPNGPQGYAAQSTGGSQTATATKTSSSASQDNHRGTLGAMLETYEFAIETEIMSRAATTLTSSVNTLIKTQ